MRTLATLAAFVIAPLALRANDPAELFEKEIRPLLARHCYACHSSQIKSPFAGLRLDTPAAIRKGSDAGPIVIPGDANASKLLKAVRGELPQMMPPAGKLPPQSIDTIEKWVAQGAPLPNEPNAGPAPLASFNLDERRRTHWAWQPVADPQPPAVRDASWPLQPTDRFLLAKLEAKGLTPAQQADPLTLLRRVTYDLTGLPPTPEEIRAYAAKPNYEALVDRLLASPRYGERMARKWMDLVRYSESHGSEGDPDTPDAWRYRDYLIRAFNGDLPYNQLIREHLAGDLLPDPRIDREAHRNESILGTAHLRMVEHGFQPVDPWEDRVKWVDNQVDVFSKAFQGLTVSCARCHDHKFDAISQRDYYALFGILAGARPTQVAIDDDSLLDRNKAELASRKRDIRAALAERWLKDAQALSEDVFQPLRARAAQDAAIAAEARQFNQANFTKGWWDVRTDYKGWLGHGAGFPSAPSQAGEFWITPEGDRVVNGIYPGGVYSNLLSNKHATVIASPRFKIETDSISLRLLGGNFSFAQLIIENYSVPRGGIYHLRHSPKKDEMGWMRWDTTYWKGFTAYLEFATLDSVTHFILDAGDQAAKPRPTPERNGRSWIGFQQAFFHNNEHTPKEEITPALLIAAHAGRAPRELLTDAIHAWRQEKLNDEQTAYLDYFVRNGHLAVTLDKVGPELNALIGDYRRLEAEVPVPRHAPGVFDEAPPPQHLLVRGNHKSFGDAVPQRYLTALESTDYADIAHARLRLAEEVASPDNPLTARVMVNRLWQIAFRRGLVASVDNFGKLGDSPSHPELLDYLARRFMNDGWSVKKTLRMLVTSQAYRMRSEATPEAAQADAANELVSRQTVRRLEAEEVRDAVLAASGELDLTMYGPSVDVFYAHDTGKTKGDKPKGPLDGKGRRSVYLEIRRNATNPFLDVFDVPKPATTRGQRDVTNTPAQPLAMMNSEFVMDQTDKWSNRLAAEPTDAARLEAIYLRTLGRPPTPTERDRSLTYAADSSDPDRWRDLAHAVLNFKEFLYVR